MPVTQVIEPVVLASQLKQVTSRQLARYAELIYRRTGIRVSPQKKMLLSNRLRRRLRATGIEGFDENAVDRIEIADAVALVGRINHTASGNP